jgi:hypothetical protein
MKGTKNSAEFFQPVSASEKIRAQKPQSPFGFNRQVFEILEIEFPDFYF